MHSVGFRAFQPATRYRWSGPRGSKRQRAPLPARSIVPDHRQESGQFSGSGSRGWPFAVPYLPFETSHLRGLCYSPAMFRKLRIALLLFVLATVALGTWRAKARATDWRSSLLVAVYPIAADDSPVARDYIATLSDESFEDIEAWIEAEARRYGIDVLRPVDISLAPRVDSIPPSPPRGGAGLNVGWWSLQFRYWSWRNAPDHRPVPQVKLYVVFHDPAKSYAVPHSLGLEKGMIGVVHAFASRLQAAQNNVVIAHELLHALGATDKYDPSSNLPLHPDGYAEPDRRPLLPQSQAEIMAGRTPISISEAAMPDSVFDTLIGPATAAEIRLASAP